MIYMDNSATTLPLPEVLDTYVTVAQRYFANPSSAHKLGVEAQQLLQQARQQIAQLLAFQSSDIFFASSGTEVNNWVLQRITVALRERMPQRQRIILSAVEHPSVYKQCDYLTQQGFEVVICPVDTQGCVDVAQLATLIDERTLLVSTMAVNNEVGSVQPLPQIAALLAAHPQVAWHVDAVQAITTELALLQLERIDLLTLSSHKFHSVRGVGILAKRHRIPALPLLYGGGQEVGMRSSTENLAAIVATAKALRLIAHEQLALKMKLQAFKQLLVDTFKANGWHVFASQVASEHIICAALPGVPGEVLVNAFGEQGVYVSTTSACASRAHSSHHTLGAMQVPMELAKSAVRLSMGYLTTQADVQATCQAIQQISQQLSNIRKGI